jgi:hypothetical protein
MQEQHAHAGSQRMGGGGIGRVGDDGRAIRAGIATPRQGFLHRLVADGAGIELALQHHGAAAFAGQHVHTLIPGTTADRDGPATRGEGVGAMLFELAGREGRGLGLAAWGGGSGFGRHAMGDEQHRREKEERNRGEQHPQTHDLSGRLDVTGGPPGGLSGTCDSGLKNLTGLLGAVLHRELQHRRLNQVRKFAFSIKDFAVRRRTRPRTMPRQPRKRR